MLVGAHGAPGRVATLQTGKRPLHTNRWVAVAPPVGHGGAHDAECPPLPAAAARVLRYGEPVILRAASGELLSAPQGGEGGAATVELKSAERCVVARTMPLAPRRTNAFAAGWTSCRPRSCKKSHGSL